ncbi:MAG: hypothetical protein HKP10_05795, partial [Kiritimatiellales bacterium]|nr:hypothetical protein [Kiritimatiellales bacterium]
MMALAEGMTLPSDSAPEETANLINVEVGSPTAYIFADLGSWHGYSFCQAEDGADLLSFCGPTFLPNGGEFYFPPEDRGLIRLTLFRENDPVKFERMSADYFPGLLAQRFCSQALEVRQELYFISADEALTRTVILNTSEAPVTLTPHWTLEAYNPVNRPNKPT